MSGDPPIKDVLSETGRAKARRTEASYRWYHDVLGRRRQLLQPGASALEPDLPIWQTSIIRLIRASSRMMSEFRRVTCDLKAHLS